MKNPITFILSLFNKEINKKNTLLYMHMMDVTHEGFFQKHLRHGTINKYTLTK